MWKFTAMAIAMCVAAFSADMTGTWKLNTAKSKYVNMQAPKDRELKVTPTNDGGLLYEFKGSSTTGEAFAASVTQPKTLANTELKTNGFPLWDAVVPTNADGSKATIKRSGKAVGTIARTTSPDGKVMTIRGRLTKADGTKANYVSVYEKQ
jgi:hypothetical protein